MVAEPVSRLAVVSTPGLLIVEACSALGLGDVIGKEALLYLSCVLESPAFSCHIQNQPPLAATALYLAIRMHHLPVSVLRLVSAMGQEACFSVNLFWEVAQAVHQTPPALDYTRFAVLVMADLVNVMATLKLQILSLHEKLMVWLGKASPGVCMQTNLWAAAALQLAIQFYTVSAPQSLLITHFGITADSLDQTAWSVKGMLTLAADSPHASNPSWSDALSALLLSCEPAELEQRWCQVERSEPANLQELVPPQNTAVLHVADTASPVSAQASPEVTCNQEQPVVTLAAGAGSPLPTAVDHAPAAADDATAADGAATATVDAARASAHFGSGSGEGNVAEQASVCHLLLPAKPAPAAAPAAAVRSQVHSRSFISKQAGKAGHGAAQQLAGISGATESGKAQNHHMGKLAAQPPVTQPPATQPPVSQLPAVQPHRSASPAPHRSSEAGTQIRITASSSSIPVASAPDMLRRLQPTQLASSSSPLSAPGPAQRVSLPGNMLPQLPPAAASSVRTDKLPATIQVDAQQLQKQLLHMAPSGFKASAALDAAQPSSPGLLASHTHGHHGSMLPLPHTAAANLQPPACKPLPGVGPLQTSYIQHSAAHCATSAQLQQPSIMQVQSRPHMQQHAPAYWTVQQQQQQQQQPLPLQLLGPTSQKLHALLHQMEEAGLQSLHAGPVQASQTRYPHPPPTQATTLPSVLLQDPGLPARVQSILQSCAQEDSRGTYNAQSQARPLSTDAALVSPMDASASASMPAKSGHSLQADLPATVGPPVDTQGASAPWSLLPGPLRAAIANAMTTEGAQPTPAGLAKSHPPTAPTPAMRPGPVLCKAGSVAHGASKGKGNKRSRADSQSHDALSGREGITGRPAGPGAVAADAAVLRQQTDSAAHTKSGVEAAPSAAALKVVVSSGAAPCISHITEGPKLPDDTAADSVRTTGSVMDGARKHEGLPSMQQSVNKVRSSQARSISIDPVKGGLPSGSGLNSSVPPELQAVAIQRGSDVNTMPAEHCSVVAQHTVQKQNGADAGAVALCQTPVSNAIGDVTLSLAGSRTTDLCTGERLAKDALLMLHDKGSPTSMPCEDILTKLTSGQAVSQPPGDFIRGVERPPPFVDVEGASAFEVDRVIDKRYCKAGSQVRVQYLVRWKGYGPDDDTWQSRNSLRHAQEAVQDYEDTH